MTTEFAALYGYTTRDVERIASCRQLIDAVILYYLNPKACYIIYKRKKYKEADIAHLAFDYREALHAYFGDSLVYKRIETSMKTYVEDIV